MAFGNTTENALCLLLFNNTNAALIGDATGLRGSSTAGSFYLSLHTASPGASGNQQTNEAAYPSYARVAVARSGSGWSVSANVVSLVAAASFPAATGTPSETETYAAIGTASSGTGQIITFAPLSANIVVNAAGIVPQLTTSTTFTLT
jgi:hypothetical protein